MPAPRVAYFSMEIALEASIPTYAGGLGVLAGDTLRAAADLGLPFVGVSLVHRKGYFRQQLDAEGRQTELPDDWSPQERLEEAPARVELRLEGRRVLVRAWKYRIRGAGGAEVPVFLLDTDLPENAPQDRRWTDHLYGGDGRYRLGQEALLGLGGIRILRALGYPKFDVYHMNEGHSALLVLGLLEQEAFFRGSARPGMEDREAVREACVFTTHTPVPAGHDRFPADLAAAVLGKEKLEILSSFGGVRDGVLDMTGLGLVFSRFVNGVSARHREVARGLFPGHTIAAITNGVHVSTWVSEPFRSLFDRHLPGWREDRFLLRQALLIPLEELERAHRQAKERLLGRVAEVTGRAWQPGVFTIGFARRAALYKRANLIFHDPERLRSIGRKCGSLQLVFAGKAHPHDRQAKELLAEVVRAGRSLGPEVAFVYFENYGMELARDLCAGVDLWLNTPEKPLEASGTSGMKAALNGVPSLGTLDGWWVEGHCEGVTGWSIGESWDRPSDMAAEARSLYEKLEHRILPLYYERPLSYAEVRRNAVALNGSFFHAQRMLLEYVQLAYDRGRSTRSSGE
ncbi:MAG: alpha-glucan phosphorylase [Candidatus Binatia bacterium]|nr:MAG: alpha-glucan phosphorylase [Candidatus Binatia bacterium]